MSFDLQKAIDRWKRKLRKHSDFETGDIEELEDYLRESVSDLVEEGLSENAAFEQVISSKFSEYELISNQFRKSRTVERNKFSDRLNPIHMLPHNLKLSFRSLLRNRADSFLNLLGLTLSLTAGILIYQYIVFENSFDQFFNNHDRIYRIGHQAFNLPEETPRGRYATTFYAVADDIKAEIPEVEATTRIFKVESICGRGETFFRESNTYFASPDFFDVFSLKLTRGNTDDLAKPRSVFISRSFAKKYFNDTDPMGEPLEITTEGWPSEFYVVKGIFEDIPGNSHLEIDAFLSHSSYVSNSLKYNAFGDRTLDDIRWRLLGFHQYVLLNNHVNSEVLASKIERLIYNNRGDIDDARNVKCLPIIERLDKINLSEKLDNEIKPKADSTIILFLKIIFVIIMLLGWINYVNLSTAKSINQAKEVGVRKIIGSTRGQLLWKFVTTSVLINAIAIVFAVTIVFIIAPYYHDLLGKNIFYYLPETIHLWTPFIVLVILGVAFSSVYPAFVVSSFKPVAILKGKFKTSKKGIVLRRSLVAFQFCVSLMLLISMYALFSQIKFMREHDLGFLLDNTVILRGPITNDSTTNASLLAFNNKLKGDTKFSKVTVSSSVPGMSIRFSSAGRNIMSNNRGEDVFLRRINCYDSFIDFYDFELIAGRVFSRARPADKNTIIINRRAMELFGFEKPEDALNEIVAYVSLDTLKIVGVVENFAQEGLQMSYEPLSIQMDNFGPGNFISIKIPKENIAQSIDFLEEQYLRYFPYNPFEYYFLDDRFNRQYQSEEKYGKILSLFTVIAIIIACLGLLGLTSLMVRMRMKEVAIRKVLGGSTLNIITNLTKEYLYLIVVAILISVPLSYYGINYWLNTFAFHVQVSAMFFIVPVIVICVVTMMTIGNLSYQATRSNPVNSLRND